MSPEISTRIADRIERLRLDARELNNLLLTPRQREQLQLAVDQLDALPKTHAESRLLQALSAPAGRIRGVARELAERASLEDGVRSASIQGP